MPRIRLLVLVPTFGLLVVGCNSYDPFQFLNSIKQLTKTWTADAQIFGQLIRKDKDPARLQADLNDLVAKIKKLVAESDKIKVPSGKEAQELWSAFQTYLKDQQRIVTVDFQELISILSNSTPDMDRYRAILSRCKETEDADLERLHQTETAFEIAHGIAAR
jgi:hypothetical protein